MLKNNAFFSYFYFFFSYIDTLLNFYIFLFISFLINVINELSFFGPKGPLIVVHLYGAIAQIKYIHSTLFLIQKIISQNWKSSKN